MQQGGIWAGLLCSNELDTIGKEELNYHEHLYYYKDMVPIPTLAMVDDLLNISNCGRWLKAHPFHTFFRID